MFIPFIYQSIPSIHSFIHLHTCLSVHPPIPHPRPSPSMRSLTHIFLCSGGGRRRELAQGLFFVRQIARRGQQREWVSHPPSPLYIPSYHTPLSTHIKHFSTMNSEYPLTFINAIRYYIYAYGFKILFLVTGLLLVWKKSRSGNPRCSQPLY